MFLGFYAALESWCDWALRRGWQSPEHSDGLWWPDIWGEVQLQAHEALWGGLGHRVQGTQQLRWSSHVTLSLFPPLTTLFWGQVVTISQLQMLLHILKYGWDKNCHIAQEAPRRDCGSLWDPSPSQQQWLPSDLKGNRGTANSQQPSERIRAARAIYIKPTFPHKRGLILHI